MIGWILLAVYVIGYLSFWRTVAYYFACDIADPGVIDGECIAEGAVFGTIFTLVWPLIALGLIVRRVYMWREDTITALIVPRSARRRAELDRRERRIAAMEREVGIKP